MKKDIRIKLEIFSYIFYEKVKNTLKVEKDKEISIIKLCSGPFNISSPPNVINQNNNMITYNEAK
jgi:hypothetical protein